MISDPAFLEYLASRLTQALQLEAPIQQMTAVGGGSINDTFSFAYGGSRFFMKRNQRKAFPHMLEKEAQALQSLRETTPLIIPEPLFHTDWKEDQVLVMEYLSQQEWTTSAWEQLGVGLALLHQRSNDQFGWEEDNYIGSLVQKNQWQRTWPEFLITQRLEPLLRQCIDEGKLERRWMAGFDHLFLRLPELFPPEAPALLHGDLWSGNVLNTTQGPALVDPAIYFGHREMDLAMTRLFGGFHIGFYEAYDQTFPLEKGHAQRVEVAQLYPLLVHVILFEGHYRSEVQQIVRRFM